MLDVKKLQRIRDLILGVTPDPNKCGDLDSVVYLQQILDAVKGTTNLLNVRGNLAEPIGRSVCDFIKKGQPAQRRQDPFSRRLE
jgi:hypothetical protein